MSLTSATSGENSAMNSTKIFNEETASLTKPSSKLRFLCVMCKKVIHPLYFKSHIAKHNRQKNKLKESITPLNSGGQVCDICGEIFRVADRRKYDKHVFMHKLEELKLKQPDTSTLASLIEDLVIQILDEIRNTQVSEEKSEFVNIITKSEGTPEWFKFIRTISDPLLDSFAISEKILPSNRYEDFLKAMNEFFLDKKKFTKFKENLFILWPNNFHHTTFPAIVLIRLCYRVGEEMQKFIVTELKSLELSVFSNTIDLCDQEKASLNMHWKRVLQTYYYKSSKIKTSTWQMRCTCIRNCFIVSYSTDLPTSADIVDAESWQVDKNGHTLLELSDRFLDFCQTLVVIIKSNFSNVSLLVLDYVLDTVMNSIKALNLWNSLTYLFMSEVDSFIFMRDMVCILTNVYSCLHSKD